MYYMYVVVMHVNQPWSNNYLNMHTLLGHMVPLIFSRIFSAT